MKITAINMNISKKYSYTKHNFGVQDTKKDHTESSYLPSYKLLGSLTAANILAQNNYKPEYQMNLSLDELKKREKTLGVYEMLSVSSPEFEKLADGDKEALKHLVKAARVLDDVYLCQDSVHNIPFREYLQNEIAKGNEAAKISLKLFNAQKGINAKDIDGNWVSLAKNYPEKPGKGFYPEDLSKEEFHSILIKMLNNGEINDVRKILNQRSIVKRRKDKLVAIDYTEYFKYDFADAVEEIAKAASKSTDENFNKFLLLQAQALVVNNPQLDAYADKAWAKLQDTPLEFTVVRESYDDRMTPTVMENPELKKLLNMYGITPYAKDNIGVRVGIVNKKGTDYILKTKEFLPVFAENMPFKDEYEQKIGSDNKQTMVDADIVDVQGQIGAYRGGISLASNLPNNDKLAVQTGGGKRNVYHIQTRNGKYSSNLQQKLDAILDKSLHKYFDVDMLHDFTILHENIHSLGPKENVQSLGLHKNIIEEHKADMGAIVMMDVLTQKGVYSPEQKRKFLTSFIVAYTLKGPDFDSAHRKRNIMQQNYYIQNGGIQVSEEGKMYIDFDKIIRLSKEMLQKAVRVQIDGDAQTAKEYIDKYAVWTPKLQKLAENLKSIDTLTNNRIETPLADFLVYE